MKAIVVTGAKQAAVQDVAVPKLRPDYVRVKVKAVALNPTDWKHIDFIADEGAIIGCDFAGVVEDVGSEVKKPVKVGDRISGFSHGGNISNHEDGAFAESTLVKDGLFMHIPDSMTFEDAATFPLGVGTVGQGLYQSLGLPMPNGPKPKTPFPVLIYGGSTATGMLALQFADLSGLQVVTTASPSNHELTKSLGAQSVFDYHSAACGQKIREATGDRLRYVFDTIALDESVRIGAEALASTTAYGELHYSALLSYKGFPRDDVKFRFTMLYTATGEEYVKAGRKQVAKPEDYEFIQKWLAIAEQYIAQGKIKPQPKEVGTGFDGILNGLDRMRRGEVSAKKLVYTLE